MKNPTYEEVLSVQSNLDAEIFRKKYPDYCSDKTGEYRRDITARLESEARDYSIMGAVILGCIAATVIFLGLL